MVVGLTSARGDANKTIREANTTRAEKGAVAIALTALLLDLGRCIHTATHEERAFQHDFEGIGHSSALLLVHHGIVEFEDGPVVRINVVGSLLHHRCLLLPSYSPLVDRLSGRTRYSAPPAAWHGRSGSRSRDHELDR